VTGTVGGSIAVRELKAAIRRERTLNGPNRYPLVTFGDTFMDTGWGGRQRPCFVVVDYVPIGAAPAQPQQLKAEPGEAPKKPNDDIDDDIPNF
jgi:hypothetical protein